MASAAAFHVQVHHAMSGDLISTIEGDGTWSAVDIKTALETPTQTPAKYQKVLLPDGAVMQDDHPLGDCLAGGGTLRVGYVRAEVLDFVFAVRDGIDEIPLLRYMLANGADVNAKADGQGRPPSLNDGILEAQDNYLLSVAMADASALHHAADHGHTEVCRLILEEPSFTEINSLAGCIDAWGDEVSMTVLHVAALNSHSDACCMILRDPRFDHIADTINELFATRDALALACQKGLPSVVSMLLEDPRCTSINNLTDQYDTTVLMLAACTNTPDNIEVCKIIMADNRFTRYEESSCRGAGTKLSGTAYDIAKANGLVEIVELWDEWWSASS